jgi:hypothetical protein
VDGGPARAPIVGVIGAGVTGGAAGRVLQGRGVRVAWADRERAAAVRAASRIGGVSVASPADLTEADVVVLASPGPHATSAAELVDAGVHVVSVSDDPDDVAELLSLEAVASRRGGALVVAAGARTRVVRPPRTASGRSTRDRGRDPRRHARDGWPGMRSDSTTAHSARDRCRGTTTSGRTAGAAAGASCAGSRSRSAPSIATARQSPIRSSA